LGWFRFYYKQARVPGHGARSPQHQQQFVPLPRLIAVERGDRSFELQLK
jgi:hypothetical protein